MERLVSGQTLIFPYVRNPYAVLVVTRALLFNAARRVRWGSPRRS